YCLTLNSSLLTHHSLAADSSSSAKTASPSPSSLQQKVDQLKQEIASKAAVLKSEVNKQLQNKVYAGVVVEKSDNKISVATATGNKTILVNEYTDYRGSISAKQTKSTFSLKTLALGDFIAA